MMNPTGRLQRAGIAVLVGGLLLGACGPGSEEEPEPVETTDDSADPERPGETPAEGAASQSEQHATVLDDEMDELSGGLPAVDIPVGGGESVSFDEGEPLRVMFNGFGLGYDYTVPEYAAAEELAVEYGIELDTFDPGADPQVQVQQLQDAMSSGQYNAAIVYPLAPDLVCDLLTNQMPAAGILVATIGQTACIGEDAPDGILTAVPDTGTPEVFEAFAQKIVEMEAGSQENGAFLVGGPESDLVTQFGIEALREAFENAENMSVLDSMYTDYTQAGSLQELQDALQRHPDVQTIATMFPEAAYAASTALQSIDRMDEVNVYAFGASTAVLENIENGTILMSVPFYPYTKVKAAIQALLLAREGVDVPGYLPYAGHAPESMRGEDDPVLFLTRDNIDAFREQAAEY